MKMMLNKPCSQPVDYKNATTLWLIGAAQNDKAAAAELELRLEQDGQKSIKHGDHDQSEHGNWANGGEYTGTGTKDDPIKTSDVEIAARALGEGKHVKLDSPDQVATLLDKLNTIAKEERENKIKN